jgi:hypothetical protein
VGTDLVIRNNGALAACSCGLYGLISSGGVAGKVEMYGNASSGDCNNAGADLVAGQCGAGAQGAFVGLWDVTALEDDNGQSDFSGIYLDSADFTETGTTTWSYTDDDDARGNHVRNGTYVINDVTQILTITFEGITVNQVYYEDSTAVEATYTFTNESEVVLSVDAAFSETLVTTGNAEVTLARRSVGVDEVLGLPISHRLSQNYPNPFNPATTISYALPRTADVALTVFDVLGREVRRLASGTKPTGTYEVTFDASGLPSGIYLYRLQAGDYVETKRMVVVR